MIKKQELLRRPGGPGRVLGAPRAMLIIITIIVVLIIMIMVLLLLVVSIIVVVVVIITLGTWGSWASPRRRASGSVNPFHARHVRECHLQLYIRRTSNNVVPSNRSNILYLIAHARVLLMIERGCYALFSFFVFLPRVRTRTETPSDSTGPASSNRR